MAKITYANKESLNNDSSVPTKNKITASDMNEIKSVVNGHDDFLTSLLSGGGHIVDNGSNSNGTYIKYENGIMIQWHRITGSSFDCKTQPGTGYFYYVDTNNSTENTKVWYYPIEFIDTDIVAYVEVSSSAYTMASIGYVQKSRMAGYCCAPYPLTNTNWVWHFIAIGRWK